MVFVPDLALGNTNEPHQSAKAVTEVPAPTSPAWQHPAPTQPLSSVEPLTLMMFVPGTINASLLPAGVTLAPQYTPPQQQEFLMVPGDDGGCEGIAQAYSSGRRCRRVLLAVMG